MLHARLLKYLLTYLLNEVNSQSVTCIGVTTCRRSCCRIRQVALRCDAPYTRHCDVDVQFHVNRACAARAHCAVPVSSTLFGDPWIRYDSAEKRIAWKEKTEIDLGPN